MLVDRAKGRSAEAWTAIYEAHYRPIYRYVRARLFDDEVAADVTSSVFVEAIGSMTMATTMTTMAAQPVKTTTTTAAKTTTRTRPTKEVRIRDPGGWVSRTGCRAPPTPCFAFGGL
jgi:DNA-directed RNA polymerase specialized sigma24 family protein